MLAVRTEPIYRGVTPLLTMDLKDEAGTAVVTGDLQTVRLTTFVERAGVITKIRDALDVKNANNGAITSGTFTWKLDAADTTPADPAEEVEELHLLLTYTYLDADTVERTAKVHVIVGLKLDPTE